MMLLSPWIYFMASSCWGSIFDRAIHAYGSLWIFAIPSFTRFTRLSFVFYGISPRADLRASSKQKSSVKFFIFWDLINSKFVVSSVSLSLSHWYPGSGVVLDYIDSWSLQPYLLWLSELFCLCCVAALKSLPALSFNAFIFPILRIVCTISFHYSCPWISSMSCTAFKITRWPIFIPRCITSAFYIPVDLY